jgi:hypothetical protein
LKWKNDCPAAVPPVPPISPAAAPAASCVLPTPLELHVLHVMLVLLAPPRRLYCSAVKFAGTGSTPRYVTSPPGTAERALTPKRPMLAPMSTTVAPASTQNTTVAVGCTRVTWQTRQPPHSNRPMLAHASTALCAEAYTGVACHLTAVPLLWSYAIVTSSAAVN